MPDTARSGKAKAVAMLQSLKEAYDSLGKPQQQQIIEVLKGESMTDLEKQFKAEVCDRGEEIDPAEEQDWFSLSLGWALAKGLNPAEAYQFALHVRYDARYFSDGETSE